MGYGTTPTPPSALGVAKEGRLRSPVLGPSPFRNAVTPGRSGSLTTTVGMEAWIHSGKSSSISSAEYRGKESEEGCCVAWISNGAGNCRRPEPGPSASSKLAAEFTLKRARARTWGLAWREGRTENREPPREGEE